MHSPQATRHPVSEISMPALNSFEQDSQVTRENRDET